MKDDYCAAQNDFILKDKNYASMIERFFVRNRAKFFMAHIFMGLLMVLLFIPPALMPLPQEGANFATDFTLFARFMIWGVWFPFLFVSVIFLGRLWCGVFCPQGALSEYASGAGMNLTIPKWLRLGFMPLFSFTVVTIFGQVVGVRDYPLAAMEVFAGTTVIAALVGLVFMPSKRVWCRFLCPVGPLLGVFSRLSAISFERKTRSPAVYPCPTFINTSQKVSSSNCIECFRCVNGENSLRLALRKPGVEIENIEDREPNVWEVVFLFTLTGLTLGAFHWQANPIYIQYKQFLGGVLMDYGFVGAIGHTLPWWLAVNYPEAGEVFNLLDVLSISTFMLLSAGLVALVLFVLTFASSLLGGKGVSKIGYVYAPVALISLVVGLGGILFETIPDAGNTIELTLLAGGCLWSIYLTLRLARKGVSSLPLVGGIFFIAFLWAWALV